MRGCHAQHCHLVASFSSRHPLHDMRDDANAQPRAIHLSAVASFSVQVTQSALIRPAHIGERADSWSLWRSTQPRLGESRRTWRISAADFPLAAARLAATWNAAEDAQSVGEPPYSSPAAADARRGGRAEGAEAAWAAAPSAGAGSTADVVGDRQGVEGGYLTTRHPLLLHRAHSQIPVDPHLLIDSVDLVDPVDCADAFALSGEEAHDPATLHCCTHPLHTAVLPAVGVEAAPPQSQSRLHAPMTAAAQAARHTVRPSEPDSVLSDEGGAFGDAACGARIVQQPFDVAASDTVVLVHCHVVFDAVFSMPQLLLLTCRPDGHPLPWQDLFAFLPRLPDHPLLPLPLRPSSAHRT
ncbi:unnamed protein product [Closterium sp. NIES-54]